MRIIDATWEKRNLGVTCLEMNCEASDRVDEVLSMLPLQAAYQLIRVPAGRTDLLLSVQERGYKTIEMTFNLARRLDEFELPPIYRRFAGCVKCREATRDDCENVLNLVESGQVFKKDRIALDPCFSAALSGRRVAFWSRDLLQKGGKMYVATYKERHIAFALNIEKEKGVYDACFSGLIPGPDTLGLGFAAVYLNTLVPYQNGANKVVTVVSSNNMPILRLHMLFEYEPTEINYVLVRHS